VPESATEVLRNEDSRLKRQIMNGKKAGGLRSSTRDGFHAEEMIGVWARTLGKIIETHADVFGPVHPHRVQLEHLENARVRLLHRILLRYRND